MRNDLAGIDSSQSAFGPDNGEQTIILHNIKPIRPRDLHHRSTNNRQYPSYFRGRLRRDIAKHLVMVPRNHERMTFRQRKSVEEGNCLGRRRNDKGGIVLISPLIFRKWMRPVPGDRAEGTLVVVSGHVASPDVTCPWWSNGPKIEDGSPRGTSPIPQTKPYLCTVDVHAPLAANRSYFWFLTGPHSWNKLFLEPRPKSAGNCQGVKSRENNVKGSLGKGSVRAYAAVRHPLGSTQWTQAA